MKEKSKIKFRIVERTEDKVKEILKLDIVNEFSKSLTLIDLILFETAVTF